MHYTVKFTGTNQQKESQALAECKSFLGNRIYNNVVKALRVDLLASNPRSRTQHLRHAHTLLSFVGVQGRYPVRALVRAALRPVARKQGRK